LAQLTGQVSVIQYPILSNSVVKHIDLIAVTDSRIMIVLVANSGRLEQATVELPKPLSLDSLDALRLKLKSTITDKKFSDVSTLISNFSKTANPVEVKSVEVIVEKVNNLAMESGDQKVMVGGAGNLARLDPDFSKNLLPVLDEIEENVVVLKLLGEMSSSDDIFVRIGHENKASNLHSASIVATGYSSGDSLSKLGIVGPTRMDYPGTMAAVGAVARYLGRILGNN
jgi:heat-inducible transcriptional repressor